MCNIAGTVKLVLLFYPPLLSPIQSCATAAAHCVLQCLVPLHLNRSLCIVFGIGSLHILSLVQHQNVIEFGG